MLSQKQVPAAAAAVLKAKVDQQEAAPAKTYSSTTSSSGNSSTSTGASPSSSLKQNLNTMSTSIAMVSAGVSGSAAAASASGGRGHYHKSSSSSSASASAGSGYNNNNPVASQQNKNLKYNDRDNNNNTNNGKPFLTHYSSYLTASGVNRGAPPVSQDQAQQSKRRNNTSTNWNTNKKRFNHHQQQQQSYLRGSSPTTSVQSPVPSTTTSVHSGDKEGALTKSDLSHGFPLLAASSSKTGTSASTDGSSVKHNNISTTVTQTPPVPPVALVLLDQMSSPPPAIPKHTLAAQEALRRSPPNAESCEGKSFQPRQEDRPEGSAHAQAAAVAAAATHYPNELLKIIRDNMNAKDNTNLWTLLNNIAGPLIIKNASANANAQFPLLPQKGSPTATATSGGAELGLKESAALLQAMEQNFIQNNPGYELLANAIFSNGGLLPSYFSDPIMASFAPPALPLSHNGGADAYGSSNKISTPLVSSPVHGSAGNGNGGGGYQQQQQQHHLTYQRLPPGVGGEGVGGGGQQQHHGHQRHHGAGGGGGGVYSSGYQSNNHGGHSGCNNNNHGGGGGGMSYNCPHPFIYNGQMYYPRPKNFWNFCINCKKSQYCPLHNNNYNSSASVFHANAAHGGLHYISVPHSYCAPEYYHRPYYGHTYNGGGGYYNHHHNHHQNNHHGQGGHRDKRNHNGRRQYNNNNNHNNKYQNGNKTPETGNSTPSGGGSGPSSPKTTSPTASQHGDSVGGARSNSNKSHDPNKRGGDRKGANNNNGSKESSASSGGKSSQYGGKKRWPQRPPNGGYDSDTSSSRSNGNDSLYMNRCNYGLLQNMKLWNTEAAAFKREQLLTGELGPHQLMSPTNHRFNAGPLLITVLEAQPQAGGGGVCVGGGDVCELTMTPPVIREDEPDTESAYWSSIFPFVGGLDEGVDSVEESTPADKYLANAHLMELVETPKELIEVPMSASASSMVNRDNTLSQQVWNTFLTVQQTQATYRKKLVIWKVLYSCIRKVFPRLSVFLVGSTITGFGAETSDIDMCVVSSSEAEPDARFEAMRNLTDLKKFLSVSDAFEQFHLIQAKVPILRFRDCADQIEVDLNYNNSVGIRNTHLLYCYSKLDWRVRPLVLVVKLWAKYHDINNAKNMTISSYSLALMVIHFLQCGVSPNVLPCLHTMYPGKFQSTGDLSKIDMNEDLQESFKSENKCTLGELLLRFLYYYSNFDFNNWVISVRTGSCLYIDECRFVRSPKNDPQQWKNLCIEEPFDYTNTARSVYDVEVFQKIKYVFVQSYQNLEQSLDLKSILNEKFISFPVHQYGYGPTAGHVQALAHQQPNHRDNAALDDNSFVTAGSSP